ncbi:MAG: 50S ribosomal protein L6, partial [Elusimicrobiaceae bacterium]|nr:50S ribosomal protein L6 [Elusimicrobiaceae bacterium]
MSRIGKKVINIPAGTKVDVKDNVVTATGKLGTLSYTVPADIAINIENG